MPFLADGHNLIPKVGLRLESVDDELELVAALKEFGRRSRKAIEVYFDGAPVGSSGSQKFGLVTAHFVSLRSSADHAISARLVELGRAARNWTVVTSDREILAAAKLAQAQTETSEHFARRLRGHQPAGHDRDSQPGQVREGGLSDEELKGWLELFGKGT